MDIQKSIRMAVDTGKVLLGKNESFRSINTGKSKLIILAGNAPIDVRVGVKKRAKLSNISVYEYEGTSIELGSLCGKPYPISVMSILDAGDSGILSLGEK